MGEYACVEFFFMFEDGVSFLFSFFLEQKAVT